MATTSFVHLGLEQNAQAVVAVYLFSAVTAVAAVRYTKLPWVVSPRGWRVIFWCGIASQLAGGWALGKAFEVMQSGGPIAFAQLPAFAACLAWGWRATWAGAIAMFFSLFSSRAISRALAEPLEHPVP